MTKLNELTAVVTEYPTAWRTFRDNRNYEGYVLNHNFPERFLTEKMFDAIINTFENFITKETDND